MALNKKQKKQIEVARKKLAQLQQLLNAAKEQTDDPSEITTLQTQMSDLKTLIEEIKNS